MQSSIELPYKTTWLWPTERLEALDDPIRYQLKGLLTELEGKLGSKDRPNVQRVQAALQEVPEGILKHQCLQKTVGDAHRHAGAPARRSQAGEALRRRRPP